MKTYPKIEYLAEKYIGQKVWAFDKLDGSNIRLEWNKKEVGINLEQGRI